ncbi:Response regulatory domain-containing protein [Burkholderia multivorans]
MELPVKRNVLVIEDDTFIRELISLSLRDAGHRVIDIAEQALRRLPRAADIEVIVVNLNAPRAAAHGIVADLRARFPCADIIAISGYFPARTPAQGPLAATLGVQRTLAKPFKCDALVALVGDLAQRHATCTVQAR